MYIEYIFVILTIEVTCVEKKKKKKKKKEATKKKKKKRKRKKSYSNMDFQIWLNGKVPIFQQWDRSFEYVRFDQFWVYMLWSVTIN